MGKGQGWECVHCGKTIRAENPRHYNSRYFGVPTGYVCSDRCFRYLESADEHKERESDRHTEHMWNTMR